MKLNEILKDANSDMDISGISYDSRNVKKGDVFVCIKGYQTDGHKYAAKAVENGAAVVVAEDKLDVSVPVFYVPDSRKALAEMAKNFYNDPVSSFDLIGITGTNGKTTVTYLIKTILEYKNKKTGLIGTNQNMIADRVIPAERTTPESFELYKMFGDMRDEEVDAAIMEVSSHSLVLDRVYGCEYKTAVFTNLTQDHLDFHGDMENYFLAKNKLFSMCENAVVNTDCPYGKRIAEVCKCKLITYGIENGADIHAFDIKISARGVDFRIDYNGKTYDAVLGIPGKFSVYNALSAIGCGISLGIDMEDILSALKSAKGVKGRAEVLDTDTEYTVLIDYAHTPDGLENIISTVNEFKKGRVITVFGCGGDRDATKRPIMGETAARLSDFCVVTSDNPRTENPASIIEQILPGVKKVTDNYACVENRRDAIEYAMNIAKKDDVIILAGKGHETYQILNTGTIHFDEREVVAEILSSK